VKIAHGDHHLFLVSGGFAEVNASKITVLAEEAIAVASLDEATLTQRIIDAEEDIATAKTEAEMAKATTMLGHLKHLRAAL
jgi:F-type H+-transporting ATPase subunit epsilon